MGAEILRQVLEDEKSAHMLVTDASPEASHEEPGVRGRLTRREWLLAHIMIFLIGAWNLFIVNLARTPDRWWFWLPVAVWAGGLIVYAAWTVWTTKRPRPQTAGPRRAGLRRSA